MDYHDEDFLPSEEEMDEIWDFLIEQSELDTPFGQAVKTELNSLPPRTNYRFLLLPVGGMVQKSPASQRNY